MKIHIPTIFAIALIVLSSVAIAGDVMQDVERLKEVSKEAHEKYLKDAEEIVGGFQKPDKYIDDPFLNKLKRDTNNLAKDTIVNPKREDKNSCSKLDDVFKDKYLYFYSYSMPEQSIKQAIKDAVLINQKAGCIKVVLVVKGMKNDNMKDSLKFAYEAIKEGDIKEDLPIEMNPELFEQYNIKNAPTVVYESSDGKIGYISGDRPLQMLISKLEKKLDDYGKEGNTYTVKENDFREIFKEKMKLAIEKFKDKIPEIKKNMYKITKYQGRYPAATKDDSFEVDLSITTQEDLTAFNKQIVPKGTTFNPAKHFQLPGEIIIIDGENDKQIQYAMNNKFYKIIITNGDLEALMKKYGKRIYAANDLILGRFAIKKTPSIITQKGDYLVITEKKLD